MSAYSNLPPIKPPRSMAWYSDIAGKEDDALEEGFALLERLRSALPPEKAGAIDEAKELLASAAKLFTDARDAQQRARNNPSALAGLLPPEKRELLAKLCALLAEN